jgi:uncharacterized damage-inducible protein DinB
MQQIKWIERTFNFGYHKGYLPFLIERLRCTAPRLQELLHGCADDEAAIPHNGAWSIKQHIGHLCDLDRLHRGRVDDFMNGAPMLRAADMTNAATENSDHNSMPGIELLARFRAERAHFIEKVLQLDDLQLDRKAWHPRLQQKMNVPDMLFFIGEHDTHHLARVASLVRKNTFAV